jgi:DNA repair protein RecO (recombination protein O)
MQWIDEGIVIHTKPLGEHRLIVTLLTSQQGCWKGMWYGRSIHRPFIGLHLKALWKSRTEDQLGRWVPQDMLSCCSGLYEDHAALKALSLMCNLSLFLLAERSPVSETYHVFLACFQWLLGPMGLRAYAYFEACLLCEIGYGRTSLFRFIQRWQDLCHAELIPQLEYHGLLLRESYPQFTFLHEQRRDFLKNIPGF